MERLIYDDCSQRPRLRVDGIQTESINASTLGDGDILGVFDFPLFYFPRFFFLFVLFLLFLLFFLFFPFFPFPPFFSSENLVLDDSGGSRS